MPNYHAPHGLDMLIPMLASIGVLLIPVAIVVIVLRHRREMAAQKHRTILELISRGAPLPTELLLDSPQKPGAADLRRGLVLSCTGIGAIIFAFTLPDHEAWGIGLLPLFVGVGYLATWLFTRSEELPDSNA
ncbi:MAG: DUF6249 domain-containing protein [Steroidobacteraceae bacterium]